MNSISISSLGLLSLLALQSLAATLPLSPQNAAYLSSVSSIDLNDPETHFSLGSGGSSVYIRVSPPQWGGRLHGAFLSTNAATNPTTEILAFNLGRMLEHDFLFAPGLPYTLGPRGVARFYRMISGQRFRGLKEQNRLRVLKDLASHPNGLSGAYKPWGPQPINCDQLVRSNSFATSSRLGQALRANHPMPSASLISLPCSKGTQASELQLAKQLSTIFVVDMLTGQYDRFSGGNLQIIIQNGQPQFYAADNGGASLSLGATHFNKYAAFTTRFDRRVALRLMELQSFLSGNSSTFLGFNSELALAQALYVPRDSWLRFKKNVARLVTHINKCIALYGERQVYFPDSEATIQPRFRY